MAPPELESIRTTFAPSLRFTCTKCAACCSHVRTGVGLTRADEARLRRDDTEPVGHPIFLSKLHSENGVCTLLSGRDCSVYENRPMVCSLYPFYLGVSADGTLQLSVDHCPGVNTPDSETVDSKYIEERLLPTLMQNSEYVSALKEKVRAMKGGQYLAVRGDSGSVATTWGARDRLWSVIFSLLDTLPASLTPRDRLECLMADLVPWIDSRMIDVSRGSKEVLVAGEMLTMDELDPDGSLTELLDRSSRLQEKHRRTLQEEGHVTGPKKGAMSVFRTRTGETFEVPTSEVAGMREITSEARNEEMNYIKEVVRREFVYAGVAIPPLTLREEASLLFYISDAVELFGNAISIHRGIAEVGVDEMTTAICEADSHLLTTVQQLGVSLEEGIGFE